MDANREELQKQLEKAMCELKALRHKFNVQQDIREGFLVTPRYKKARSEYFECYSKVREIQKQLETNNNDRASHVDDTV